jgi:hypothetical protein
MQGAYVNGDGKEIGTSRRQWRWCGCKDVAGKARAMGCWHGTRPEKARQGCCDNGITKKMMEEREDS